MNVVCSGHGCQKCRLICIACAGYENIEYWSGLAWWVREKGHSRVQCSHSILRHMTCSDFIQVVDNVVNRLSTVKGHVLEGPFCNFAYPVRSDFSVVQGCAKRAVVDGKQYLGPSTLESLIPVAVVYIQTGGRHYSRWQTYPILVVGKGMPFRQYSI